MHHTLAMSSTEHNLWTIANILGIVVVVAVAALLSLLIYLVKIIDRRVVAVRDTLKAAEANTADTNRELRTLVAPLPGKTPADITAGKMTYDLRRLREHGLIARIPHTRRYQVTDTGLHDALLFTHAHDHLLRPGLAQLTDPSPPAPSRLRAAARAYQAAYHDLARQAHLAA